MYELTGTPALMHFTLYHLLKDHGKCSKVPCFPLQMLQQYDGDSYTQHPKCILVNNLHFLVLA